MPFCQNCGRELSDIARFCIRCGQQTPQLVATGAQSSQQTPSQPELGQAPAVLPTKRRFLKWGGIGCGGLLGLFFLIAIIAAALEGAGQKHPTPNAEPAAAARTPNPTATLGPTTPPEPATTPLPAEMAGLPPCFEAGEKQFVAGRVKRVKEANDAINSLDRVVQQAIAQQADWNHSYVQNLLAEKHSDIRSAVDDLRNQPEVPPRLANLNKDIRKLADAMNDYEQASELGEKAYANGDYEESIRHNEDAARARTRMDQRQEEVKNHIRDLCKQLPGPLE